MTGRKPGRPSLSDTESARVRQDMRRLLDGRFEGNRTRFAKALGRSQPAVTQILNETSKPSMETAKRVAALVGVRLTDYLDETARPWVLDDKYPSKAKAAQAATDVGFSKESVDKMLTEDPEELSYDPGARYWLKRVELHDSAQPNPAIGRRNGRRSGSAG